MSTPLIPEGQVTFLRDAASYLESPSLVMRLADLVGRPLDWAAQTLVPARVLQVSTDALRTAMDLAVATIPTSPTPPELQDVYASSGWTGLWHNLATLVTGGVGGLFGIAGLAVELPVTTSIMFRSIAAIAADHREDLSDPAVRLDCLHVFSYGGPSPADDALESTYLTTRMAMAGLIAQAARFLADHTAQQVAEAMARGTAGQLLNFLGRVAGQFGVVVSKKALAQAVPVVGAVSGAAINLAFSDHFNRVARFHFGVRQLERQFGEEPVQACYKAQAVGVRKRKDR